MSISTALPSAAPVPGSTDVNTPCAVCRDYRWDPVRTAPDTCQPNFTQTFTLSKCCSCGHVAQVPAPTDDVLQGAYSASYAPYRPAWKQRGWPLWKVLRTLTTRRRTARLCRFSNGNRLLEVGSGAGDFLHAARALGWNTSSVEYNEESATTLREELGLDVRSGELCPGLWSPGEFDAVVFWSVLEHVKDPQATLATASGYLKPGGVVLMQIPTKDGVLQGKRFGPDWVLLELPRHLNFFGKESLSELCSRAGLELIAFKTPTLDTAWCHLASAANRAKRTQGRPRSRVRFLALAAVTMLSLPWLALGSWSGRGTEAFAVAVKKVKR